MDPRLTNFVAFLREVGLHFEDQSIRFVKSRLHGFGVCATVDIASGQVIAKIPKSAVLSVETAALWCDINQLNDPSDADEDEIHPRDEWCLPAFQLPAAILFETLLAEKSRWFSYLDVLPKNLLEIGVPLGEEEQTISELFQGTGIDILTHNLCAKLQSVFETSVRTLFKKRARELNIPEEAVAKLSWQDFSLAYAWFTSRAFMVDETHGSSFVPVADMFNHSTDQEHVHIQGIDATKSDDDSDDDDSDDDDMNDEEDEEEGEEQVDGQEQQPSVTGNHIQNGHSDKNRTYVLNGYSDSTRKSPESPDSERDKTRIIDKPDQWKNELDIACVRNVKAGEEIYNTFGQKCNTILYLNYGFTEVHNMYDTAFVYKEDVDHVLSQLAREKSDIPDRETRGKRQACIDAAGVLIYDNVVDDFFQIHTDGSFCSGLLLLAYMHVVPWTILQTLCDDELELLDHLMQLSVRDIMDTGNGHMPSIVNDIVKRVEDRFPHGSSLVRDREALASDKGLSLLARHALRIRIGQRRALKVACEKLFNCVDEDSQSEDGAYGDGDKCIIERVRKKAKAD